MIRYGLRAILVGVVYLVSAGFLAAVYAIFRGFGNLMPISGPVRQLMKQSVTFSAAVALLVLSLFVYVMLIESISRWRSASILLKAYNDRRRTSQDSEADLVARPRYGNSR
jgi:hypothetical protein